MVIISSGHLCGLLGNSHQNSETLWDQHALDYLPSCLLLCAQLVLNAAVTSRSWFVQPCCLDWLYIVAFCVWRGPETQVVSSGRAGSYILCPNNSLCHKLEKWRELRGVSGISLKRAVLAALAGSSWPPLCLLSQPCCAVFIWFASHVRQEVAC